MASWYSTGLWQILQGGSTLSEVTVKALLLSNAYTFSPSHATLSQLEEITAIPNYAIGPSGSGRKAVTLSFGAGPNTTNNRVDVGINDITWTTIGGASNATIGGVCLYIHNSNVSDAANIPLAYFQVVGSGSGYTTNGSDFLMDFAAQSSGGNLRLVLSS